MTPATRPGAHWPNLFVVGVARSGTTTLWRYLNRHPEIWMAPNKEPNFFSGISRPMNEDVHDEGSYLRLFAPGAASKFRGEASVSYIWAKELPERIMHVSPESRFLISLRDPVERAYSGYWLRVRIGVEDRPFAEAIRGQADPQRNRYLAFSLYAENVRHYLETCPGAVHVLFLEELAQDPHGEMRRIFEFLGLDAAVADRLRPEAHNVFALPRSRLAGLLYTSRRFRAAARAVIPLRLRLSGQDLLLKRPPSTEMDPEVEAELIELFAPDVERLRVVLGRDVPWPRFNR
jgi:Sulfotransferase family